LFDLAAIFTAEISDVTAFQLPVESKDQQINIA
jgi:hypothetical protein